MATSSSAIPALYSVNHPSRSTTHCSGIALNAPPNQFGKKELMIRSPTLKRVTPAPTATTSPAPSESGTRPGGTGIGNSPLIIIRSRTLSELARTRTSTSPTAGDGTLRSATTRPSRLPGPSSWYTRILGLLEVIFESFSIHQSPINVALGSNGLPLSGRFALPRARRLRLRSCLAETATSEDDFSGEPPSFVGCEKGSDQSDVFRYAGST